MIEGLVSTVAYANAKAIFAANRTEPAARKALAAKPIVEVQFSAGTGTAQKTGAAQKISLFPFGKKELLAVTGAEGPVFTVEAAAFERFQKGILEYRQRSLLEHEARAKIDEIIFQFPREKQSVHMKKNGEAWAIVGGDKPAGELSQARVNSFLDSLRDADFQASFSPRGSSAEAKSYQTLTPELELEVKGGGATLARQRFVIHARQAALTESEGEVKALGAGLLQFLPVRVSDFDVAANQTVVHTQSLGNP